LASAVKNTLIPGGAVVASLITKLPRGKNTNIGSVTAQNDVVAFSISEPTGDSQGGMVIQAVGGVTPTYALNVSIDQGVSWGSLPATTTLGAAAFGDTSSFQAIYTISGYGSGAQFRFGRTDATGGAAVVWGLIG
jgi:hypothetical protein